MAPRTIPARIVSLICLLALLLAALPCANAAPHQAMKMGQCDTCCTEFSATSACCTAAPQPAATLPQPFAPAFTLDHQRLPPTHEAIPTTPVVLLATIRNTSPPPLHTILRI